jgi:hypothetical protein
MQKVTVNDQRFLVSSKAKDLMLESKHQMELMLNDLNYSGYSALPKFLEMSINLKNETEKYLMENPVACVQINPEESDSPFKCGCTREEIICDEHTEESEIVSMIQEITETIEEIKVFMARGDPNA